MSNALELQTLQTLGSSRNYQRLVRAEDGQPQQAVVDNHTRSTCEKGPSRESSCIHDAREAQAGMMNARDHVEAEALKLTPQLPCGHELQVGVVADLGEQSLAGR